MMTENTNQTIDFESKDFEETQKLLSTTAKLGGLRNQVADVHAQKSSILNASVGDDNNDVIQKHLDKFDTVESLEKYLDGKVTDNKVADRINEFFTNDETGEVLTLLDNDNIKSESDELEFKRGMLLYFKQNDYYISKIDEEIAELDKATKELNDDLSTALNPLKDNILAYAEYLEKQSVIEDTDDDVTKSKKRKTAKKAKAIRSGYTFDNLIELIETHPSIIDNALKDSKNDDKIREIGKRYQSKLNNKNITFNLFQLLNDDIHNSLEYCTLPIGDYPAGLENFTVFFIIRAMSMGLTTDEDVTFHASVQVALTRLKDGTLDEEVADTVKESMIKLLNYFDK